MRVGIHLLFYNFIMRAFANNKKMSFFLSFLCKGVPLFFLHALLDT